MRHPGCPTFTSIIVPLRNTPRCHIAPAFIICHHATQGPSAPAQQTSDLLSLLRHSPQHPLLHCCQARRRLSLSHLYRVWRDLPHTRSTTRPVHLGRIAARRRQTIKARCHHNVQPSSPPRPPDPRAHRVRRCCPPVHVALLRVPRRPALRQHLWRCPRHAAQALHHHRPQLATLCHLRLRYPRLGPDRRQLD